MADGEADLFLQSIGRSDHPIKKDRVRGALNLQVYRLKALPDDQGTEVEVEINVDPAGNFPVFIVNLYGSKWCKKTLDALGKTIHNMGAYATSLIAQRYIDLSPLRSSLFLKR